MKSTDRESSRGKISAKKRSGRIFRSEHPACVSLKLRFLLPKNPRRKASTFLFHLPHSIPILFLFAIPLAVLLTSAFVVKRTQMQRQPYAPNPATSPPLHHPVPQHVSTVPMMRSPPPPAPSAGGSGYGGSPYGAGQPNMQQQAPTSGGPFAPAAFGGFVNDHTAQMGFQVGKTAVMAGQEYLDQNVGLFYVPPLLPRQS